MTAKRGMTHCGYCGNLLERDGRCLFCPAGIQGKPQPLTGELPRAPCGWPTCTSIAKLKMITPRGWLNLCPAHYEDYWLWTPKQPTDPNGWKDQLDLEPTRITYRQRWYEEHGKLYEPPKAGNLSQHQPPREPGSDDDLISQA